MERFRPGGAGGMSPDAENWREAEFDFRHADPFESRQTNASGDEECALCGDLETVEYDGHEYPCPSCWPAEFAFGEAGKLLAALRTAREGTAR